MPMNVQLEAYEGPLDLLLHLIKKNEVSIADIPIALITQQYLETLEVMRGLNLDLAGEFLIMASTLIHIKSRMLLPPEEGEEDEDEGGDPREELIRRLLEYQRYKEASEDLAKRELLNRDVFTRSSEATPEFEPDGFVKVSLFDLMAAFHRVLERLPEAEVHLVTVEEISVREKMSFILDMLHRKTKVVFHSLFEDASSRMQLVATFLALLELIKMRAVSVTQEERMGPIVVEAVTPLDEMEEKLAGEGTGEENGHGA
ncbi:MAG: segregation/condensation protein A [Deltaproteobacteria bacterium]|nr:segregation/condensation protein A [Deltaproteobacteria bacterium]